MKRNRFSSVLGVSGYDVLLLPRTTSFVMSSFSCKLLLFPSQASSARSLPPLFTSVQRSFPPSPSAKVSRLCKKERSPYCSQMLFLQRELCIVFLTLFTLLLLLRSNRACSRSSLAKTTEENSFAELPNNEHGD